MKTNNRRLKIKASGNNRVFATVTAGVILALLLAVYIGGALLPDSALRADFSIKSLPPSAKHLFGTDFLGRDMFARTVKGLSLSLTVGALASACAALIALIFGVTAAMGKGPIDHAINWIIDVFMSVPHTLLIILISAALAQGSVGIVIGIALTHWVTLARVIRSEALQLRSAQYIAASRRLGSSMLRLATGHVLPHMLPQFFVGLILLFPHAILHESGLTFLGFGLPPERPAIGIILSESAEYLSGGALWLAFFPGASLVSLTLLIAGLGNTARRLLEPREAQL